MNEQLNENSPDVEILPWHEKIKKRAEAHGYDVKAWEISGEGAIAAVMGNENCLGPFAFLFGTTRNEEEVPRLQKWQDWQVFNDYSNIFPGLVAYHSCTGYSPKSKNKRIIASLLKDSKSLIKNFEESQRRLQL